MTCISSRATWFYKRVIPCLCFGFIAICIAIVIADGAAHGNLLILAPVVALTLFVAFVIYAVMKRYLFCLVDEVWDCGDAILVRNKGREERITLADCESVTCTSFVNPPSVRVSLRRETEFGREIAFLPPIRTLAGGSPPIVKELTLRIEAANTVSSDPQYELGR